jgi:ABC-type antimicrobial peptide transport system permease subunit
LNDGKSITTFDATPGLLASSLRAEYPEIQYSASVIPSSWFDKPGIISFGDRHLNAAAQFSGKDYFSIFSIPVIKGNKQSLDVHSVFLSRELCQKLFATTEVLGKAITWDQNGFSGLYTIAGVFENPPANSTVRFDILFNYDLFLQANPKLQKWSNNDPVSFIVLKKDVDLVQFNKKIADFMKSKDQSTKATILLQKFSDRYLHNHYENGSPSGGRIEYVRLFSMIAIFILIIACINFMNLATARASRRMKEVGIKKILGASRLTLIAQHICETLLISFAALIFAALAVLVLLPSFNSIVGKQIVFQPDRDILLAGLIIATFAGLLAGSYPASILQGLIQLPFLEDGGLRVFRTVGEESLVVFQFTYLLFLSLPFWSCINR